MATGGIITSGGIGLGIGFSVGALVYFSLITFPKQLGNAIHRPLLFMVGAGMVLQATQFLIQADRLPAQLPVVNLSTLLPESSVTGQLAYALFGYEATPSLLELSSYFGALGVLLAIMGSQRIIASSTRPRHL
jgi:high-affinity iron transporter